MALYRFITLAVLMVVILGSGACKSGKSYVPVDPEPIDETKSFEVRACNPLFKIIPTYDLADLPETYMVEGAKRENEPFQVVPRLLNNTKNITGVMAYAGDLVMGEHIITKDHVTLFKEYYVTVTQPSDNGGMIGYWPDPIIPLTRPFDVNHLFPSTLWVNIDIPEDAEPGVYDGTIFFESEDAGTYEFNYELYVWDILMPKQLYLNANFGLDQEDITAAHGLDPATGLGTPEGREIALRYTHYLAERYISVHGVPVIKPNYKMNSDQRSFMLDFTEMEEDIATFLDPDGYDLKCFYFPLNRFDLYPEGFIGRNEPLFSPNFNARLLDYVNQVSAYLQDRGYLDRSFVLFVDEPYTLEHYNLIIDSSKLLRQADIYPRIMVTEQPAPQEAGFPELYDYVDIFTTNIRVFQFATEEELRVGAENNEEWIYSNTSVYPYPSYSIDKQGLETRLFVWFAYQRGFKGVFYSSACDWSKTNPWEDPLTFGPGMGNGCNNMMYQGQLVSQYTEQENVDGPIGSIRLELSRDGLEDAELLYMLGQGEAVPEANTLMNSWEDYCKDPEEFFQKRHELAEMIMSRQGN